MQKISKEVCLKGAGACRSVNIQGFFSLPLMLLLLPRRKGYPILDHLTAMPAVPVSKDGGLAPHALSFVNSSGS